MNYSKKETPRDNHAKDVYGLFDRADDLTTIVHLFGKETGVAPWEYYAAMALEVLMAINRNISRGAGGSFAPEWNFKD